MDRETKIKNENMNEESKAFREADLPEKRPLTVQQRTELIKLRDRLLNLSSRNRSIRLNRLDSKWAFDLSALNPFGISFGNEVIAECLKGITSKVILPKPHDKETEELHQKLSQKLVYLHRSITELQREKGLHDLYIGFPFLRGIPVGSETVIQAPVFLLPVTLEKKMPKKGVQTWVLSSSKEMPIIFNKTLFIALSKICNLKINPSLFEEDIPNELYGAITFIQQTHKLLNEYGVRCDIAPDANDMELDKLVEFKVKELPPIFQVGKLEICQNAILGHFPQSNSSIQHDYDKFLEFGQTELDSLISFLSSDTMLDDGEAVLEKIHNVEIQDDNEFLDNTKTIDDRSESENFLLLPSDSSQDRILMELSNSHNNGMVVWGPPGTGKSQTIVNLIGDCLARGKNVLLVSQKRAALDVVNDRLGMKNLTSLVGLVHDAKADRKDLYAKINSETIRSNIQTTNPGKKIIDPSSEIERIGNILKDVVHAYNDETFGVKLGEIYRRLGGSKSNLIPLDSVFWKGQVEKGLQLISTQIRSFQKHIRINSTSKYFSHRKSFSTIENHEALEIKNKLLDLIDGENFSDSCAIVSFGKNKEQNVTDLPPPTSRVTNFLSSLSLFQKFKGPIKYFKPSYWRVCSKVKSEINDAQIKITQYKKLAQNILPRLLNGHIANGLIAEILSMNYEKGEVREFVETFYEHFNELKGYDIAFESLSTEAQKVVGAIENANRNGTILTHEDWGNVLERSVYSEWVIELEKKYPVINLIRSGQIDNLRNQYKELIQNKVDYCVQQLKEKVSISLMTPEGERFKREINSDVVKCRNILSIRKLNEKYFNRIFYRSMIPVWLASPETVSDVFPLEKGLFDVVIFDEASQCTVEHGLPAIYRGKQVVIAGDEKQLSPSKMFEVTVEETNEIDEDAYATEEPSLLTLAKKNLQYKPHLLEWHYRSKHQELITFSNEVFYGGRMKIAPNVIPFQKGNKPAIQWHTVKGYWEDRTNREEALKILERIRYFLSQESPPTIGVITFNAPQKELILDLLDDTQEKDPEFAELLLNDSKRPVDSQLFVKNIENVQGDEREVILFSVAYAPSEPNGRVNQLFGSLNAKGGENRLNVAVTRAIKAIEIIASINPEHDLNVSTSVNAGPKILRNYLRFAHAVAHEDFDRLTSLLLEMNPNLQSKSKEANVIESPFEAEVLDELKKMGFEVHTQVGQSGFRIDMAIIHPKDSSRYLLGIECDGAMFHSGISVRERDVFRQKFLEDRGWVIHRVWSTNWWDNKDKEISLIRGAVDSALKACS